MMERFEKPGARLLYRFCVIGAWALTSAQTAFAQDLNSEEQSRAFGGPDAALNRIESDSVSTDTPLMLDFLKPWYEWKDKLQKERGLAFGVEYNSVYLRTNDRLPGADKDAAGGIFRFSGVWEAFGRGSAHPGNLVFLVERTDEFTDTGPSSFLGESLGYAGISNLPYNDEGWRLNTLYWDQKFQGGKYEVVGGYLDISDYVDVFPLVSPWTDYFNYAFSIGVGALDLPSDGALGFAGAAWLTDNVYAMTGFVDENADATDPREGFDTFFNDRDYFKHFEIGWTGASQEAYYLNNVHLTLWHADEREDLGPGGRRTAAVCWNARSALAAAIPPVVSNCSGQETSSDSVSIGASRMMRCSATTWMISTRPRSTTDGTWPMRSRSHRVCNC